MTMNESQSGFKSSFSASTGSFLPIEILMFDGEASQSAANQMSDLHCSVDSFVGRMQTHRWQSEHSVDEPTVMPGGGEKYTPRESIDSDVSPQKTRRRNSESGDTVYTYKTETTGRRAGKRPSTQESGHTRSTNPTKTVKSAMTAMEESMDFDGNTFC